MSLEQTDMECAAVARAPRVSLDDIKSNILDFRFRTAADCVAGEAPTEDGAFIEPLKTMTLCFMVMKNGFVIIGKSAPASPENFDAELGKNLAFDDAIGKAWPLMGYALRDRLHEMSAKATAPATT